MEPLELLALLAPLELLELVLAPLELLELPVPELEPPPLPPELDALAPVGSLGLVALVAPASPSTAAVPELQAVSRQAMAKPSSDARDMHPP